MMPGLVTVLRFPKAPPPQTVTILRMPRLGSRTGDTTGVQLERKEAESLGVEEAQGDQRAMRSVDLFGHPAAVHPVPSSAFPPGRPARAAVHSGRY